MDERYPILTFERALDYVFRQTDYERMARVRHHAGSYDLRRMAALCEAIGRPQDRFSSVHVAGTKGKGSTTTMLANLLAGGGLSTGLYTSPHLSDIRERVVVLRKDGGGRVRSELVSPDEFVTALNAILSQWAASSDRPTFFELITAIGFEHFARCGVDAAAVEVGLGGRLDATNVLSPKVCVISPIGIDHVRQLGDTVELIAAEKAGIIKPGAPVVSAAQQPGVERVIRQVAADRGSEAFFVGREIRVERKLVADGFPRYWRVTVRTPGRTFADVNVPLLGRHQAGNAAVALAALDRMMDAGVHVDVAGALAGLGQTRWPGRLEARGKRPWLVLDGAHTVEAMQSVLRTLPETFDYRRLIVVAGCLTDKDVGGIMGQFANGVHAAVLTRSDHPHAADPEHLAELVAIRAPHVERHVAPEATSAVARALHLAGAEDLVLVTGSIYLVGLVGRLLGQDAGSRAGS